eukprot:c37113_g1_i1 orf=180-362(+)
MEDRDWKRWENLKREFGLDHRDIRVFNQLKKIVRGQEYKLQAPREQWIKDRTIGGMPIGQ